jgi:hypothetical protein
MVYRELQRKLQVQKLHYKHPEIFNQDKGGGRYKELESMSFVLLNGLNNLYPMIQSNVISYFEDNKIAWWGDDKKYPSGHLLSSQIQCLNFLFALRKDKQAILKIAQHFDTSFDDIQPTFSDKDPGYIAFEFVYENANLLGEDDTNARRGEYCTSIDAFIIALKKSKKILIPIEWKYTERYLDGKNMALEKDKGKTRQARYNHLILESKQLITQNDLQNSVYYYEPFYEIMRQTLLVEQMVNKGIADDYLHLLVTPSENKDLLENNYTFSKVDLQTTWRNLLVYQEKFKLIDNKQILRIIENLPNYKKQADYLKQRYL